MAVYGGILIVPSILIITFLALAWIFQNNHLKMLFFSFSIISIIALLFGNMLVMEEYGLVEEFSKTLFNVYTIALIGVILLVFVLYLMHVITKNVRKNTFGKEEWVIHFEK